MHKQGWLSAYGERDMREEKIFSLKDIQKIADSIVDEYTDILESEVEQYIGIRKEMFLRGMEKGTLTLCNLLDREFKAHVHKVEKEREGAEKREGRSVGYELVLNILNYCKDTSSVKHGIAMGAIDFMEDQIARLDEPIYYTRTVEDCDTWEELHYSDLIFCSGHRFDAKVWIDLLETLGHTVVVKEVEIP